MAYKESQTLCDTDRRLVLKLVNVGTVETANLVVNSAALAYALSTLTLAANTTASPMNFNGGETVNAAAGGSAIVQSVVNNTSVKLHTVSGTFTTAQNVTGALTGTVRVQNGALSVDSNTLQVSKLVWDVQGVGCSVELLWQGNGGGANNRTIAVLSGQGVLEADVLMARIPNNANNATGNILLTTNGFVANSTYTVLMDVAKSGGYAAATGDQRFR